MTHAPPTSVIGFTIGEHNFIIAWTAETSFQAGLAMGRIAKEHDVGLAELIQIGLEMEATQREDNS